MSTVTITAPGLYTALSAEDYHADPTPEPSLSSSVARLLLNRSASHAWHSHPRLNPDFEPDGGSRGADLGSAVHKLVLGRGASIAPIDADGYTTKAAREARDEARVQGRIPMLTGDYQTACAMADAAQDYLRANGPPELMADDCASEAVLAWREGKEWCRAMLDRVTPDHRTVLDVKTTARSARADHAARTMFDMGYHVQAAFYERGLNVLFPDGAGRRRFLFLFQETEPPYACQLIRLDEASLTIGRKQVMASIDMWKRCRAIDRWPGYPTGIQTVNMPEWMQAQWLQRELSDPLLTGDDGMPPEPGHNSQFAGWTP